MAITISETPINGLILLKPDVFTDERGYFTESFNEKSFEEAGISGPFVQDNQSLSSKGALRGLHFQNPPHAQSKLVRVISGAVMDVVVDIRKDSETYGKSYSIELSSNNFLQLFIPKGFAHGFYTLKDETVFAYKCSTYYHKNSESGLMWNDPDLNIQWNATNPILSVKDQDFKPFHNFNSPF